MKKIILLLLLSFSLIAKGQQSDSSKISVEQLKDAILFMRDNNKSCHKQFSDGITISVLGAATIFVSPFCTKTVYSSGRSYIDNHGRNTVFVIGSLIELTGLIMIADAHKFIGRNGHWKFTGNSVILDWQ